MKFVVPSAVVFATTLYTLDALVLNKNVNGLMRARGASTVRAPLAPQMSTMDEVTDLNTMANPTIEDWLEMAEPGLRKTTLAMFRACKEIAYKIRTASCDKMACFNEFGDEQLSIDILANNVIFQNLKACGFVETASSQENPTEDAMGGKGYSVAFDPLDGSSIIDSNFAVGTVWCTFAGDKLTGVKGSEIRNAGLAIYGPRTSITVAQDNVEGAHEFLLVDDFSANHGQWLKTNDFTAINEGKLFSPGNLRATQDNKGYSDLFNYWMVNQYQLRYTGGMVPDVNQIMVKGKGVFVNCASPSAQSKLSLLYEVAPLAFIMEKAGGRSSDGVGSILDVEIRTTEQVTQVALGSPDEVDRFTEMVGTRFM